MFLLTESGHFYSKQGFYPSQEGPSPSHLSKMAGAHQSRQSTYLGCGWSGPFPSASSGASLAWLCPAAARSSRPGTAESRRSAAGSGCGEKFVQQLSRDRGAQVQPALTKTVGFFPPFRLF